MADSATNEKPVNNSQGYIFLYLLLAIFGIGLVIFLFKSTLFDKRTVEGTILKDELFLNEDLVFTDNTRNAKSWLWEFGNGSESKQQNGKYRYPQSGSYIVRLTVDGELKEQYPIIVKDTVINERDTVLAITGPTSGVINEEVRLEAVGSGNFFQWSFGESNRVDVKGRTALYTYRMPGRYLVKLVSETGQRPIYHSIIITDPAAELAMDMVMPGEGERKVIDDIRARLQAIASGRDFNSNYYYLTRKYLCNNEKVTVEVDQDGQKKSLDFYSYCMGLTFGGDIMVDEAQLTLRPNSSCAGLLTIKQHSTKITKT